MAMCRVGFGSQTPQTKTITYMGVSPKIDGLFHGKPYEQMDDLGVFPFFFGSTPICLASCLAGGLGCLA